MQQYENNGCVKCALNCFFARPNLQNRPLETITLLFTNLKKMLQGKNFGSNEEVITETEAYFDFEWKDKSFHKKGIEKLEER